MKRTFTSLLAIAALALITPTVSHAADTHKVPTVPAFVQFTEKPEAITTQVHSAAWIHRDVLATSGQTVLQTDQWAATVDTPQRVIHVAFVSSAGTQAVTGASSYQAGSSYAGSKYTAYGATAPPGRDVAGSASYGAWSYRLEGLHRSTTPGAVGLTYTS